MSKSRTCVLALLLFACLVWLVQPSVAQTASSAPGAESIERFKGDLVTPKSPRSSLGFQLGNLEEYGATEMMISKHFENALKASTKSPVLIFKHSTTCGISAGAYERLGAWLDKRGKDAPEVFLVKVRERRPVSNEIEARLEVEHESPQIILIKDKKTIWHTSHDAIDAAAIENALGVLKDGS